MPPKRNPPLKTSLSDPSDTTALQSQWTTLYRTTLPTLARAKAPAQPKWPVVLDHCFARIILDNAPGIGNGATPWMGAVKAPATRNMSAEQLRAAIALGEKIQGGEVDLVELDEASLRVRGKESKVGEKRKREEKEEGVNKEKAAAARNWSGFHGYGEGGEPKKRVKDEHTAPSQKPIPDTQESITKTLTQISSNASLTPYRKHVLTLLTQVPRGRYTTYQAIANAAARIPIPSAFHSANKSRSKSQETEVKKPAARAVGMAMRDNPYAPMVPCHRVLASDGSLGGYKGEYEKKGEGEFQREKRRILREEGVKFDGGGKAVGSVFTGFVAT